MSRYGNRDEDDCGSKIFVRGLNRETRNDGLRAYFEKNFGLATFVRINRDYETGASRGFGVVHFAEKASAEKAVKQKYHLIDGAEVEAVRINGRTRESNDGSYQKSRSAKYAVDSSESDEETTVTTASLRDKSQVEARSASKPSSLKAHAKRSIFSSDSDVVKDPVVDRRNGKNVNSHTKTDVKYALDSSESDEETIVTTASLRDKSQVEARPASKPSSLKAHAKRSIFSSDSDVVKDPVVDRRTGKNVNSHTKPKTDVKCALDSSESDEETIVTTASLRDKSQVEARPASKPSSLKAHAKRSIFSSDSDVVKDPVVDRHTGKNVVDIYTGKNVNSHTKPKTDVKYALDSSESDEETIVTTASLRDKSQVEARPASKPSSLKAHAKRSIFSSDSDVVKDPVVDRRTGKNVNSHTKPKTDVKCALDSSESDEETIVTTASLRDKSQVEARPASKPSSLKAHAKRSIFSSDSDVVKDPVVDFYTGKNVVDLYTGKNVNSHTKPKTDVKYALDSSESDEENIVTMTSMRNKNQDVARPASKPSKVKNYGKRNIFSSDSDVEKAPVVDQHQLLASLQLINYDTDKNDKEKASEVALPKKEVEKDKRITNTEENLIDLSSGPITKHPTGTVDPSQLLVPESSRSIAIVLPGGRFRRAKNNRIHVSTESRSITIVISGGRFRRAKNNRIYVYY